MKHVYKVWCEWDIGLNEVVFASCDGAWAAAAQGIQEMGEDIHDCESNGLVGVETWEIME